MGKKRLIDADELIERLKEKCKEYSEDSEYEAPGLRLLDESIKSGISYSIMQVYTSPTVLEYSDEPLSLEELKEIDWEFPVYIVGEKCSFIECNDYSKIEYDDNCGLFYLYWYGTYEHNIVDESEYCKTWFAYLRKQEKEE